nr:MAG TPA: BM2 protein [Caudoviricetes sp.]
MGGVFMLMANLLQFGIWKLILRNMIANILTLILQVISLITIMLMRIGHLNQ